jgi:hypothetical protein
MQSLLKNIEKDKNLLPDKKGKKGDIDASRKSARVKKRKLEEEDMVEKTRYVCLNRVLVEGLIFSVQRERKQEAKIYIL